MAWNTDLTITNLPDLDSAVAETLHRRYAYNRGEFCDRIHSFGTAITLIAVGNWLTPVPPHRSPHAR